MPESIEFAEITHSIKEQFAEINSDFIQAKISEMERLIRFGRFVPLFIKSWFIKNAGGNISEACTSGFSNLGLIKPPKEIQDQIETFSFALSREPNMPYQFACVAVGDALTFTTTTTAQETEIIDRIVNALKK